MPRPCRSHRHCHCHCLNQELWKTLWKHYGNAMETSSTVTQQTPTCPVLYMCLLGLQSWDTELPWIPHARDPHTDPTTSYRCRCCCFCWQYLPFVDICWQFLVFVGIHWHLSVIAGDFWSLLVSRGICCYLLGQCKLALSLN